MADRIIRIYQSPKIVGFSISMIYNMLNPASHYHDPTFPKPLKLGARAKGFRHSDLEAWVASRKPADL
ncbi:MAG: prophage regulatory protein [Sulfitobacter sp.]|jgi:prophage regulatory protein